MNRNGSAFSFLLEYLLAVLFFVLCSAVTIRIYMFSSQQIRISLQKRMTLEYVTGYIENGIYRNEEYHLDKDLKRADEGEYTIRISDLDQNTQTKKIEVFYQNECLIEMEFYGGEYE